MPFKFTPKPESEISKGFEPLPPGKYPFTVLESAIAISKSSKNSGREMVKVNLVIHGQHFDSRVYDYFADWFSEWKLKHFLETVGRAHAYVSGQVDPSNNAWADLAGFVRIGTEENNKGRLVNVVEDYLPDDSQKVELLQSAPAKTGTKPAPVAPPEEDDVPF